MREATGPRHDLQIKAGQPATVTSADSRFPCEFPLFCDRSCLRDIVWLVCTEGMQGRHTAARRDHLAVVLGSPAQEDRRQQRVFRPCQSIRSRAWPHPKFPLSLPCRNHCCTRAPLALRARLCGARCARVTARQRVSLVRAIERGWRALSPRHIIAWPFGTALLSVLHPDRVSPGATSDVGLAGKGALQGVTRT